MASQTNYDHVRAAYDAEQLHHGDGKASLDIEKAIKASQLGRDHRDQLRNDLASLRVGLRDALLWDYPQENGAAACERVRQAAKGEATLNKTPAAPMADVPAELPPVELRDLHARGGAHAVPLPGGGDQAAADARPARPPPRRRDGARQDGRLPQPRRAQPRAAAGCLVFIHCARGVAPRALGVGRGVLLLTYALTCHSR